MKVTGVVGWLQGRDGTGNVFKVVDGASLFLAMIWADGKFHFMGSNEFADHQQSGKALLNDLLSNYSQIAPSSAAEGIINVENPVGWERFYTEPSANEPETESADAESVNIPVSFSFTGNLKISVGGLSKILSILD